MKENRWIKVWIIIIVVWLMVFSNLSFAQEVSTEFWSIWWVTDFVVSILSWIWVIFAKIAWELLTNNRVYWEVLWIDVLLWQYWNVMKNIANFGLGFYFVYVIFIWFIWKEKIEKKIKDIIIRMLVAWVWIQISWFATAAVIDVSTITLVAAGSFPSQLLANNERLQTSIKYSINDQLDQWWKNVVKWSEVELFSTDWQATSFVETRKNPLEKPVTMEEFIDAIMPNADTISWPLYYLWFSILDATMVSSVDDSSENWIKNTILNLIIQWWTTIVYSIEMWVFCILALMRIIYLWMFIVLSPIAVLLFCIEKSWIIKDSWGNWKWFLGVLTKQINFKSFFVNVFKPTIIVFFIWLAMLFAALMKWVLIDPVSSRVKDSIDIWGVTISSTQDNTHISDWNTTYTTTMSNNLFKFSLMHIWKWFLDFVLSVIVVVLVYIIISMAVKMWWWKDFVSDKIWKIQKSVEWLMTSIPLMPVAWYDKEWVKTTNYISAGKVLGLGDKRDDSIIHEKIASYQRKVNDRYTDQDAIINSRFNKEWGKIHTLSANNEYSIRNAATWQLWLAKLKEQKKKIDDIRDNKDKLSSWEGYWMTLDPSSSNKFWLDQFKDWLDNVNKGDVSEDVWKDMIQSRRDQDPENKDKRDLWTLFKTQRFIDAYAELFWLGTVTWWEELKKKDISISKK